MAVDEVGALFARAKGRGKARAKAVDAKVDRWEWASGPLPGRSPQPLADYLEAHRGKLHRKPPTPKHGTHAYGLDAKGRVLVVRNYFSKTAYTEIQYAYAAGRFEWVSYRHDAALLGVGIARLEGGVPKDTRARAWDGRETTQRVTSDGGRITKLEVESRTASGTQTGFVYEASWSGSEIVKVTRRHRGPLAKPEVIFERSV